MDMRFKTLRGSLEGKAQRGQSLLVGLDGYKWYQSQTPSSVQQGHWAPKRGGL